MNSEQKKILFKKILPKFGLLIIIISAGIFFFVMKNMGNKAKAATKEFMENGGSQTIKEFMENGGSQTIELFDNYNFVKIDNRIIKYPKKYKITYKYGSEKFGGVYIFFCDFPKDELTFSYSPKEIIEGLPSSITSVDNKINNLEEEIVASLAQMTNKKPILEEIKTEKIGDYNVRIKKINYNENTLYIYGLETDNQYFTFTSHLKYLLNAIVQKLNDKK